MSGTKKITVPPSKSGYFKVELGRTFEHAGFAYTPAADAITVNRDILDAMLAEPGTVLSVAAA